MAAPAAPSTWSHTVRGSERSPGASFANVTFSFFSGPSKWAVSTIDISPQL
jgi:hypothetical protein